MQLVMEDKGGQNGVRAVNSIFVEIETRTSTESQMKQNALRVQAVLHVDFPLSTFL